jgi:Uma2 family endonuclease
MTAISKRENIPSETDIPDFLVYEELNGRKLYRKGYKNYLNQTKTIEEIMGSSSLQGIVISIILSYLYRNVEDEGFAIITNEAGLHVSKGNNLSSDIILYRNEDVLNYKIDEHYFNVAPKIVIEVDIKVDLEKLHDMNYFKEKTLSLFGFGVERVIWIFTNNKTVILAEPNQDWIIRDWSKDFELIGGHTVNLLQMIEKKGYQI